MTLRWIRNALALAGVVVVITILFTFYRAARLHEQVQVMWVSIEGFTIEYTFTDNTYFVNGQHVGTFRIRWNRITFSCGNSYHIRIRANHSVMLLDGFQYVRR